MALTAERRADLEDARDQMTLLAEMIATPGWQKIIGPALEGMRQSYFTKLMTAKNIQEMFKAQCAVKSIDMLISDKSRKVEGDVDRRIREGQEAAEILKKDKEPDEPEENEENEETDTG